MLEQMKHDQQFKERVIQSMGIPQMIEASIAAATNRITTLEKQIEGISRETKELKGHFDKLDAQDKKTSQTAITNATTTPTNATTTTRL